MLSLGGVAELLLARFEAKPKASTAPRIGAKMPAGSIYAGTSPDSGKGMYATQADAALLYSFSQANEYAANLDAHGHQDWRVPTKGELNVLFQNRAPIGGFDTSGSYPVGWYWSSWESGDGLYAGVQRFSGGYQSIEFRINESSLRCVRG